MILRKIFTTELVLLLRSTSTWLYAAVLVLFTFVMNGLTTPGDGVFPNNTFHLTATVVMGLLLWLVMGAAVAGEAAARDVQARMHPLTYTTPVTKGHYLGGRFLAAGAVNAGLVLCLPLGVLLSFYLPGLNGEELLPFRPWAYLSVYFLIALPGAFVATALQFTFAALGRRVMASYMASLLLALLAQVIAVTAAKLTGNWDLVILLDPVGVTGLLGNELQTWTAGQKNTRLVRLEGIFLWNRILWTAVAIGSLWFTWHRFRFAHTVTNKGGRRFKQGAKEQPKPSAAPSLAGAVPIAVPPVRRDFGPATYIDQVLAIAGASFAKMARHWVGLTLVGALGLVSVVFADRILAEHGVPILPTTQQVLAYLAAPINNLGTPWVVIPLLLLYFSGALVREEREAGLADLADTAPVAEWVLFTGKFLGLVLIIGTWLAVLMATGIGMQLSGGYDQLEPGLYVQALFGLQLADYGLLALLALAVHVVVNHKYIGHLVMLLVFLFMAFPSQLGVEHPLLVFGAGPGWWYTDMRGFGPTLGPWLWFKLYWAAWALLLAVAARVLWARGREQSWRARLGAARRRLTGPVVRVALLGLGLIVTLGSFIFYNTNVLNGYETASAGQERQAEYERRYGRYRHTPQPQLAATRLHVELYPDRQQAVIRAAYTLVNREAVAIDSIHMGSTPGAEPRAVTFNRPAAGVLTDKERGHYIYALQAPLQPGDSLQVDFVVQYQQQGFRHSGTAALVVENGTFFTNYDLLPAIGYQPYRELQDAVLRKKQKLAARPALPSLYDPGARKKPLSTDHSTFEAVVGTAVNEVAVAPGRLLKTWTRGGRRYFHYKTDAPIGGEYALLSSHYAVQERQWKDVAIRIYYHPAHARNIERMLRSVEASLAYYTEQFGPYPFSHLTVVERPGGGAGASADAGLVYYGEPYAFMNPDDGPGGFDLPFYIMAHEMAHQWWGLARLTPAHVEGAGVLIEGLAVYAGMQVLEKTYGEGHLQQYVDYLHDSYAIPRSSATPSLLQANEAFLYYRKGGLALHALGRYLGQEKVNGALKSLLRKRSSGVLPLPTTLDLYRELRAVTPDSLDYLLRDLFGQNTYWRLKTKRLTATPAKGGQWEVTLQVQAQKVVIDPAGNEKEVPMNDWLEVGLYEEGKGLSEPLYLRMHRIRSGEQTLKVTVPRKPDHGGIDPAHLMIDLRLEDNTRELSGGNE